MSALGLQAATSYMATEQYVQNVVKAESNRTDIAIGELQKEVQDAKYLTPSAIKAGDNVSVTTNEAGEVTIAATDSFPADYAAVSNAAVYAAITNALQDAAISTLNDTKASKSDATLTPIYSDTPAFSEWVCNPSTVRPNGSYFELYVDKVIKYEDGGSTWWAALDNRFPDDPLARASYDATATKLTLVTKEDIVQREIIATRTRTDIIGYTLGSQSDKPVAAADPLLFAQYYPEGNVKSTAEFTAGIKYTLTSNATERTSTVKPFCITDDQANDNSGLVGRVVIPPYVDAQGNPYISDDGTRYKVVGVSNNGSSSMVYTTNLTAIVAPNTVTNIGDYTFALCTALTSVSLPAATTIGDYAFDYCIALTSVSFPAATTIGDRAFYSCTALKSVSFPAATTIGDHAFDYCIALKSVSLPVATTIGDRAFYSCAALASVSLPDATTIGDSAFESCTALASVSIPVAMTIEDRAFYSCTALASASLPGATNIGRYAFYYCTALISVSLPDATTIGDHAFYFCTEMVSVDFGDTPRSFVPTLGIDAFSGVPESCKIIVPDAQYDAWIAADGWRSLVTRGYKFLRHSAWEYARKYETFTIKVEDNVLIFSPQE